MSNSTKSMLNKICVVTGATSGIGKETAKALAIEGATIIIVGRDVKKCISTVNQIKKHSGNSLVDYICSDLSDLKQVHNLTETLKQSHDHIDVLVNNAGAYFITRQESVDAYEMNLALNYLSPVLLTTLLQDMLDKSVQGRIINVSSIAHLKGSINFDNLQSKLQFIGFKAYAQSKLALILYTYELARKLKNTKITVNALHPGFVATNFGKNNGLLRFYIRRFTKGKNDISAKEGAETIIFLATSPNVTNLTSGYFVNNKQVKSSDKSYNQDLAKQLWDVTENLIKI